MIALARPHLDLFDSWSATITEFGAETVHGAGLEEGFVPDRAACAEFIDKAELYGRPGAELPEDKVACDYFWITEDGAVVGFIAFRRALNEWLRNYAGHIGYSVRPSARRRGIASTALALLLEYARAEGYDRVMLTCDDDNAGSARTIEGAGGELTGTIDSPDGAGTTRQYWIAL